MIARDSRRVPRDQIESVVKELYAAADRLDWVHMAANARTVQYDLWVNEPEIGGVLTKYMSAENARSCIKDGPMKEFARARLGAGRYAQFGAGSGPTLEAIVEHALGSTAQMIPGSDGIKPFHCLAVDAEVTTYVVWGTRQNLRHLVWACVNHMAINTSHRATIVVLETFDHPTTLADKTLHANIAKQCTIGFKYLRIAPSSQSGSAIIGTTQ